MLRSRTPELVTQEISGHLCCHYAIRLLYTTPVGNWAYHTALLEIRFARGASSSLLAERVQVDSIRLAAAAAHVLAALDAG